MPGYIEDRWMFKRINKETGKRERKDRYGQGLRYRVCGIPGVKDESFATHQDAKNWLASAQTDVRRGVFIDPELGQQILRDYFEEVWWPGAVVSLGTRRTMLGKIRNHILPHLGHMPLAEIQEEHIRAWVATVRKTQAVTTTRVIYGYLSAILGAAHVSGRKTSNPCSVRGIKPKKPGKKARAFTAQQVGSLREELRARDRIVLDIGIGAGLRQGEVLGFAPEDIDEAAGLLHIRRQVQRDGSRPYLKLPKGDKERDVPLSDGLLARLRAYMEQFEPVEVTLPWIGPGGPGGQDEKVTTRLLVTTRFRNAVDGSSWDLDSWKPALGRAGIIPNQGHAVRRATASHRGSWPGTREFGFHITRHTYASVQLQAGESIVDLSSWLGHDDPGFTLRTYTHFMPGAGAKGRTAMDAWMATADA